MIINHNQHICDRCGKKIRPNQVYDLCPECDKYIEENYGLHREKSDNDNTGGVNNAKIKKS